MGAWGHGHFENDFACDFAAEMAEKSDWAIIKEELARVAGAGDDDVVNAPDCEVALAASAIIAHLAKGHPIDLEPEDQTALSKRGRPDATSIAAARTAVARIKRKSELKDVWEEAGTTAQWLVEVEALERALQA